MTLSSSFSLSPPHLHLHSSFTVLHYSTKPTPTTTPHRPQTPFHISLTHNNSSLSASTDSFLYGGCTQQQFTPNLGYESNLDSLLTSLVNSATYSDYNNFTVMGSNALDVVYGLYQCRDDLSMPNCAACVARAVTRIGVLCELGSPAPTLARVLFLCSCLISDTYS